MNPDIKVGGAFPNITLPDHRDRIIDLKGMTSPTTWDNVMGWDDGYPVIVVFYRGFY